MKRIVMGPLLVSLIVALVMLALRSLPSDTADAAFGVADSAPGSIAEVAIDMNTAGNTPNGLIPSVENCNAVAIGGTLDIDIVVDEIDITDKMNGVQAGLSYTWAGPGAVSVTGVDTAGQMIGALGGSSVLATDDATPDTDGTFLAGSVDIGDAGAAEWGEGVLHRITLTGVGPAGVSPLWLSPVLPVAAIGPLATAAIPVTTLTGATVAVGDVNGDTAVDVLDCVEGPPISETWSGPLGSHGATGTFITNVESFDGNVWTILGPAGLNTGHATFSGDLNLEDPVSSLSGGEPMILLTNLGVSYSNVVVRTTIQHNSVNGAAIGVRTFLSPGLLGGYYFVVQGSTGMTIIKKIDIDIDIDNSAELAASSIPSYDPSLTYELEFSVFGNRLSGVVRLENEEVASLFALDDTFTTGNVGLFGTTSLPESPSFPLSDQSLNVTFGDFFASPLPPPGGTVELLVDGSESSDSAADGSGPSAPLYAAIAGGAAAAAFAIAAGGWYARRRFRQRRI